MLFSEETAELPIAASILSALNSDDEDNETMAEKATKKKKKAKRLVLSDDEDDGQSDNEKVKPEDAEEPDIESDGDQNEVMYDSEENEIQTPKIQKIKGIRGKHG